MVRDTAAVSLIHLHRSKEAFAALIDAWIGILVSDGYGVDQNWVRARQTCLAHLIRSARAGRLVPSPTWQLVGLGPWRSCSGCVIWPQPH